jgi:hypothetical protein
MHRAFPQHGAAQQHSVHRNSGQRGGQNTAPGSSRPQKVVAQQWRHIVNFPNSLRKSGQLLEGNVSERALIVAFIAVAAMMAGTTAQAEKFKSAKECVPGTQVVDLRNRTGTVVSHDETMCKVQFPSGTESLIFWMLNKAGDSPETNDKLVPGVYECFAGGRYTFMDMKITGANTYQDTGGNPGKFHVEMPSRKIVFETGSFSKYHAKLLDGPAIGLNSDGGSFYATTCELRKGKK